MADTRNRFKGELVVSDLADEEPISRAGADLTPFLEAIDKSWAGKTGEAGKESGSTLGITVPLAAKTLTETRLRDAAKERGLGVSIVFVEPGSPRAERYNLRADQCRAIFNARPKKAAPKRPDAAIAKATGTAAKGGGLPKPTGSK